MKSFKSLANVAADHLAKNNLQLITCVPDHFTHPDLNGGYGYVLNQLIGEKRWHLSLDDFEHKPDSKTLEILTCANLITCFNHPMTGTLVYCLTALGIDYMRYAHYEHMI